MFWCIGRTRALGGHNTFSAMISSWRVSYPPRIFVQPVHQKPKHISKVHKKTEKNRVHTRWIHLTWHTISLQVQFTIQETKIRNKVVVVLMALIYNRF